MTKPPKIRFRPGMKFEYDGSIWILIYMFRLRNQQGIWYHCLEEEKELDKSGAMLLGYIIGNDLGYKGDSIIYEEFRSESDARNHFRDRMMLGSQTTMTTQELLKLKRIS